MFPHHEMSAAHAYACSGLPLADHYAHAGMVGLDGEKMSKSLGNLVLVSRLRSEGVEPAAIRTTLAGHHYRSDWFWTPEDLGRAQDRLRRYREALPLTSAQDASALLESFRMALADDLNAPAALAAADEWAAALLDGPDAPAPASPAGAELAEAAFDALLGIRLH